MSQPSILTTPTKSKEPSTPQTEVAATAISEFEVVPRARRRSFSAAYKGRILQEAQQEFEVGILALHSFWYEEARDHFRKAWELDSGFAMAYWGEAMTHDAPLQGPGACRTPRRARRSSAVLIHCRRGPQRRLAGGKAVRFYRDLLDIWKSADADLPAFKEAQDYVERSGG